MPNDTLPKKLLFRKARELCPPGCPRSRISDVVLHAVNHIISIELMGMLRPDCFAESRLALHTPSSLQAEKYKRS